MSVTRKQLATLFLAVLLFVTGSCALAAETSTASYQAGSYTGTGAGRNGDITVKVTLSDTSIESIKIVDNNETEGISTPALTLLPQQIVQYQSLKVDAISGCTLSCNGVLEAVTDALKQANADVQALQNKEVVIVAKDTIEKAADVVIIGAGGAGTAAAMSAAQNGASVILIEKTAAAGGNTLAGGGGWNAVIPGLVEKKEMDSGRIALLKTYLDYDDEMFAGEYRQVYQTLKQQINDYLKTDMKVFFDTNEFHIITTYLGGLRNNLDGVQSYGDFDLVSTMVNKSYPTMQWLEEIAGSEMYDEILEPIGGLWSRCYVANTSKLVDYFEKPLAYLQEHGGEIMYLTKAESLIVDGGRVVGVNAVQSDGTKVVLTANKGVIITTGGYGANPEMLVEYDNYWGENLDASILTTNVPSITGDGIRIAVRDVDAKLTGMDFTQMMPIATKDRGILTFGTGDNMIMVNKEGKRFVNEGAERDVLSKAAFANGGPGGTYFAITLKNNFLDSINDGSYWEADTIEELANQAGIDPAGLTAEVEKYNQYVDNGLDEDFGKTVFSTKLEITGDDKFIARELKPSVHHTMGGLTIDVDTHVYNNDGEKIPGLYAAGEVTGGIHAGNRVGGNAIADIFVFGKIAGENAALSK